MNKKLIRAFTISSFLGHIPKTDLYLDIKRYRAVSKHQIGNLKRGI